MSLTIVIGTITPQAGIRTFWKDHQHEFPVLSSIARDVLSIPATGAGVERLFNSARDVCHYRRGSLKSSTIQELMMFMCTEKFDIEEKQLAFLREYRTGEEKKMDAEEEHSLDQDGLEPISDNEEDTRAPSQRPDSQLASNKRQRRATHPCSRKQHEETQNITIESDQDENHDNTDDDDDVPLPNQHNTQQRTSGRARKIPKSFEGYDISHS